MKKIALLLSISFFLLLGCKKNEIPILVGKYYSVNTGIFNHGAWKPNSPIYANRIYTDPNTGETYCDCFAKVDWNNFAMPPVGWNFKPHETGAYTNVKNAYGVDMQLVANSTIDANYLMIDGADVITDINVKIPLRGTSFIEWLIPVVDLKR